MNNCIAVAQPLITNDWVIAIKLPETIPAPCIVEKIPPEIGPMLERPIKPKIYGKNTKIQLTVGINRKFKLRLINLLMIDILNKLIETL